MEINEGEAQHTLYLYDPKSVLENWSIPEYFGICA